MNKWSKMICLCLVCCLIVFFFDGTAGHALDLRDQCAGMLAPEATDIHWREEGENVGSLRWNGLGPKEYAYTFADHVELNGMAEEKTQVYVGLFFQEKNGMRLWASDVQPAASSGMIQVDLPLPILGEQYLLVMVCRNDVWDAVMVRICRSSQEIEQQLTHLYVNLFEAGEK